MRRRSNDRRILVVAAHPDDEVLGCGGTIARLAKDHHEVHVAILGEGMTARYARREEADPRSVTRLQEQARQAARHLGAASVAFAGLPDNRFDTVPLLDITKLIEQWIARVRPEALYTHHPGDVNSDHAVTFHAVLAATRPVNGCGVKDVYAFEIPSSTEWSFQRLEPPFRPSVFTDISRTLEAKLRAMRAYTGEMRPFPHPRSSEALRAIAKRWGSVAGVSYAEAFELIRSVR